MLQDIKNTIKQSAIYGLSRISAKLVALILLPIITLKLSVSDYGVYIRIDSLWQILTSIYLFGLESGIIRWYTLIDNEEQRRSFLFSSTLFALVINIIFFFLLFSTSELFSEIIFRNTSYSILIIYASIIASLETLIFLLFLIIRIQEKVKLYTFLSILISLLSLGLQYYYLTYSLNKLEGIFLARIIATIIVIFLLLPYYLRYLKPRLDIPVLKELAKYSFPVMIATLLSTLLNQSDRYILGYLTNSAEVGIYGLGYNICGLMIILIISPFSLAFSVVFWKKLKDENAKRFFTKSVTYLFFAVVYLSIFVSLFTPNLIKIFTLRTDYWAAKDIVPWIAASMPFYGITTISIFSYYATKNTKPILYFYLISLCANIILNFVLIKQYAMYGAAVSNFVSFSLLSLLFYSFSKREYFFEYEWLKIFSMFMVGIIIIYPFFYFHIDSISLQIALKVLALVIFPLLLYPLKFYEPVETQRIRELFNKYIVRRHR